MSTYAALPQCGYLALKLCMISRQALLSGATSIPIPRINKGIAKINPTTGKTSKPTDSNNKDTPTMTAPTVLLDERSF
jgi:hypothetical protein